MLPQVALLVACTRFGTAHGLEQQHDAPLGAFLGCFGLNSARSLLGAQEIQVNYLLQLNKHVYCRYSMVLPVHAMTAISEAAFSKEVEDVRKLLREPH